MRRTKFYVFLGTLLLLFAIQAEMPPAEAQTPLRFTLLDINGGDLSLFGRNTEAELFVPIQSDWVPGDDLVATFLYTASPLLSAERSTVTLEVGDVFISSFIPIPDGQEHEFRVVIPSDLISSPGIDMRFTAVLSLQNAEECEERFNVAQWLTFSRNSVFTIEPILDTTPPDLAGLPSDIVVLGAFGNPPAVVFVLPENPTATDLTAAARVAARLGVSIRQTNLPFSVVKPSTLTQFQRNTANMVVVGTVKDQPLLAELAAQLRLQDGLFVSEDGEPIRDDQGAVAIFNSPWNPARHILVVSANGEEGLELAGESFQSTATFETFAGPSKIISALIAEVPRVPGPPWSGETTTLAQLDFADRRVTGTSVGNISLFFRQPPGWIFEEGTRLTLHMAFSPDLRAAEVFMDVFLNDVHLGTIDIKNTETDARITFEVPPRAFNLDVFGERSQTANLRLTVDDNLTAFNSCEREIVPWVILYNDSFFKTEHSYAPQPDLQFFPYPFVNDPSNPPITIVVPPQPARYELQGALSLAASFGNAAFGDLLLNPTITLVTTDQVEQNQLTSSNVVIIGTRDRQELIDTLATQRESAPDVGIFRYDESPEVGVVEEITSPWNPSRTVLMIYAQRALEVLKALNSLYLKAPPVSQPGSVALVEQTEPRIVYRAVQASFPGEELVEAVPTATPVEGPITVVVTATPPATEPVQAGSEVALASEVTPTPTTARPQFAPTPVPVDETLVEEEESGANLSGPVPTELIVAVLVIAALAALGRILLRPHV